MRIRLVAFTILIGLLAAFASISVIAQDEAESEISAPEDLSGAYIVELGNMNLTAIEVEEGAYTITLSDIENNANWVITMPYPNTGFVSLTELAQIWSANPDLVTQAIARSDIQAFIMTLDQSAYDIDSDTWTIRATNLETFAFDPEINEEKDLVTSGDVADVTLFITTSADFANGLIVGRETLLEGTRTFFSTPPCTQGVDCPGDQARTRPNN